MGNVEGLGLRGMGNRGGGMNGSCLSPDASSVEGDCTGDEVSC